MCWKLSAAAAILGCLSASPAAAADPNQFFHEPSERTRSGGFLGATISILPSDRRTSGPGLRLGLGLQPHGSGKISGLAGAPRTSAIQLDFTVARRPAIYLGGRRLSAAEGGGGWGTGETVLAIAGVAAAVFLATQLGGSDDDDDEQCMIEPELCD
jgi:hypothetical protein